MNIRGFLVGSLATLSVASFADVTFSETDFNSGYVATIGTSSNFILIPNGPTGRYLSVEMTLSGAAHPSGFGYSDNWTYNPSTQGAVSSVDFSLDFLPSFAGGRGGFLYLTQGSETYFKYAQPFNYTTTWNHETAHLVAGDFFHFTPTGFDSLQPDFSSTGSSMTVLTGITFNSYSSNHETFGFDNINITFHNNPTPEPATLAVAGFGLVGMMMKRRKA